jgi:hypothetical protein
MAKSIALADVLMQPKMQLLIDLKLASEARAVLGCSTAVRVSHGCDLARNKIVHVRTL